MDREYKLLADAIVEVLQCDISELQMDTSIVGDLGADSLDAYQILMHVQDELEIELAPEDVEKVDTISDAYTLIKAAVEAKEKGMDV